MTDHELNELRRIERLPLQELTEEDWAVRDKLLKKRRRELCEWRQEESDA